MATKRRGGSGILFLAAVLAVLVMFWLPAGQALAADSPAIQTYPVSTGDTLWLLAQRYQTSIADLKALNGIGGESLTLGQTLYLPVQLRKQGVLYRVQQGDTLYLISRRTGRSIESIQQLSSLKGVSLSPGQLLLIPAARPEATLYMVASGDTLWKVSQKFGVSLDILSTYNRLPSAQLFVGQILEIPAVPAAPAPQPAPAPAPAPAPELPIYRVAAGDTLSQIAYRFGTTVPAIYQTNRLHSNILMPGQPLYMPPGREPVSVEGPRGEQKPGYGEFLDWEWARWVYNVGITATITDFYSGRTFHMYYMGGANHADSEPLTKADTTTMLDLFGGQWSWNKRPVLVGVDGRVLAGSLAGEPHSVEKITDNGVSGHFDLYFWNSRSHNTSEIDPAHQQNVLIAAGRQ